MIFIDHLQVDVGQISLSIPCPGWHQRTGNRVSSLHHRILATDPSRRDGPTTLSKSVKGGVCGPPCTFLACMLTRSELVDPRSVGLAEGSIPGRPPTSSASRLCSDAHLALVVGVPPG
jgi:hypothetical protein